MSCGSSTSTLEGQPSKVVCKYDQDSRNLTLYLPSGYDVPTLFSTITEWAHGYDITKIDGSSIYQSSITLSSSATDFDMDNIDDGSTYAKVLSAALSAGSVLLSQVSGDLDNLSDGATYGRVLLTQLTAGNILLANITGDLDDLANGTTYGKVLLTSISAGSILLAQCSGDLDDVVNGTTYGRVALTAISAGKILLTASAGVSGSLPVANSDAKCTDANADQTSANETFSSEGDMELDDIAGTLKASILQTVVDAGYVKLLRLAADTTERLEVTAGGIEAYANNVKVIDIANTPSITVGEVGASKSNVHITAGALQLRNNTTAKITLAADGSISLAGGITMGTAGYLRTTGKDNYADTTAGIFIGYDTDAYKLNIGDPTNYLNWSGAALTYSGAFYGATAGNLVEAQSDTSVAGGEIAYTKRKEFTIGRGGTYRITWDMVINAATTIYSRVYRNGTGVGTEKSNFGAATTACSDDVSGWSPGDLLQIYSYQFDIGGTTQLIENTKIKVANPMMLHVVL